MPPLPSRQHSYLSSGTTSNTTSNRSHTSRPLPPLPSTAVELDVPTLYPRRRAESQATSVKHSRSFSHPFPSFFGGGSKKSERRNLKNRVNVDSTDDDDSIGDGRSNHTSNVPSRNPSVNASGESMTGRCMACDSTVRWPRDLKVFRCTICLTVNDLEPNQEASQPPLGTNQTYTHAQFAVHRKRTCRLSYRSVGQWLICGSRSSVFRTDPSYGGALPASIFGCASGRILYNRTRWSTSKLKTFAPSQVSSWRSPV
jgi:hypothetical protein